MESSWTKKTKQHALLGRGILRDIGQGAEGYP